MDLSKLGDFIQIFGFPTVACVAISVFAYKLVNQMQETNIKREDKLYNLLADYGGKMSEITATLEKLSGKVDSLLK